MNDYHFAKFCWVGICKYHNWLGHLIHVCLDKIFAYCLCVRLDLKKKWFSKYTTQKIQGATMQHLHIGDSMIYINAKPCALNASLAGKLMAHLNLLCHKWALRFYMPRTYNMLFCHLSAVYASLCMLSGVFMSSQRIFGKLIYYKLFPPVSYFCKMALGNRKPRTQWCMAALLNT